METQFDRFKSALEKMLMLDQADLDFGIYRIMNQKREDIETYLNNKLKSQVTEAVSGSSATEMEIVENELKSLIKNLTDADVDPETSTKVKTLRAKLAEGGDTESLENEVYSHLTTFFSRYYDGGDFISQRRYKKDVYAIPYEGEEVKLHWANADQYYIKTGEYFRNYRFSLSNGKAVEFTLKNATVEQNNNIAQDKKERRFALYEDQPIDVDGDILHINFTYELQPTAQKQDALIKYAYDTVKGIIPADFGEVFTPRPTDKDPTRTILQKHLKDYVARNTFDYFIHKDLNGFLSRELDFYVKNEILVIDDIDEKNPKAFVQHLAVIKAIKTVGKKIITFLASLEEFQKKLWLKKKFVVQADYCITLDRVPEELYPEICANDKQREEWVNLFAIDEIKKDGLLGVDYTNPLTVEFLKANPFLVVDTAFFSSAFKNQMLSKIDNRDEQCEGMIINSENSQALDLLIEKYKGQVKCIYIDPPYNTGSDDFIYKDGYQNSTWLAMMQGRLIKAKEYMPEDGIIFISIGEFEQAALKGICDNIFGSSNFITQFIWEKTQHFGRQTLNAYSNADYILCYAKKALTTEETKKELLVELIHSELEDAPLYNDSNKKAELRFPAGSVRFNIKDGIYTETTDSKYELRSDVIVSNGYNQNDLFLTFKSRWSQDSIENEIKRGATFWIKTRNFAIRVIYGADKTTNVRAKQIIFSNQKNPHCCCDRFKCRVETNENASSTLENIFGKKTFSYPKPSSLISYLASMLYNESTKTFHQNFTALDYFAGSGTTGHAIINLNRNDNGSRKYILCEMGEYFNTVTKPRIQKVIYSKDWKDGKPVSREGSSHCFKYMRLEQYEDTLNNLVLTPQMPADNGEFHDSYMLGYLLDTETKGSLFNLQWFRNPWNTKLLITRQNETKEENVDLIETFNYLIGLNVESIRYPKEGLCTVEGVTRTGERTLIIWRNVDVIDNEALNRFFKQQAYSTRDTEFDRIYVNGDNNLENLRTDEENWKVVLTEKEFAKRMFEDC